MKMPANLLLCALIISSCVFASDTDVSELRNLYYKASENKQYSSQFYKKVNSVCDESIPIHLCYKGMALFLRCRQQTNPYFKLADFNSGKRLLEMAVKRAPTNVEIRFMRFCIQSQAPRMLGYNEKLTEDKNIIVGSWSKIQDEDLRRKIKAYMLAYGNISEQEKTYLQ